MSTKLARRAYGLTVMVALISGAIVVCAQDYTVRMKDQDGNITIHYVSRNAVRDVDQSPVGTDDVIYRLDQRKIIPVDHRSRIYLEIPAADIGMAKKAGVANLTPEMREVIRATGYQSEPATTLIRVGTGESIAEYRTQKYVATVPCLQDEIWIAPALGVPLAYYDLASASLAAQAYGVGAIYKSLQRARVRGFVMKIVAHATCPTRTIVRFERIALSVDKGVIPPSMFEPPAGYTKAASKAER